MRNQLAKYSTAPTAISVRPCKYEASQHPSFHTSHVLIALEWRTGKILWQRRIDSDVMSAPVIVGGEVFATPFSGTSYRFEKRDGKIISAQATRATSAPVVLGDQVLVTQRIEDASDNAVMEQMAGLNKLNGAQWLAAAKTQAIYLDARTQMNSGLGSFGHILGAGNGFFGGHLLLITRRQRGKR